MAVVDPGGLLAVVWAEDASGVLDDLPLLGDGRGEKQGVQSGASVRVAGDMRLDPDGGYVLLAMPMKTTRARLRRSTFASSSTPTFAPRRVRRTVVTLSTMIRLGASRPLP